MRLMISIAGKNLFPLFLVWLIIMNAGRLLQFISFQNQLINFLPKPKKANNLSNKKLNRVRRVKLEKKLEMLNNMWVKRSKTLNNMLDKRLKMPNNMLDKRLKMQNNMLDKKLKQ